MAQRLLGGMTPPQFIRRHWQKSPLLVRNALAECTNLFVPAQLFALSERDDIESRLVLHAHNRWEVRHGPFTRAQLRRLPERGWTLLVQGIDQALPEAARLMQTFAFIPHARCDDLMASYAPPGGGVGPHFDSYDVFLIQAMGTRSWSVSAQRDLALRDHAPLRILKRFRPQREWRVNPGDLLYLPPRYAHQGVALTPCITLSVGFRAPSAQELGQRFLEFLQDRLQLAGGYEDADLAVQRHPAQIAPAMLGKITRMLEEIRWTKGDIHEFSGRFLTEPKPHVVFERPQRPLSQAQFMAHVARYGARLALKSRMLFTASLVFINGESYRFGANNRPLLIQLADKRELPAVRADRQTITLLHGWYRAGYLDLHR